MDGEAAQQTERPVGFWSLVTTEESTARGQLNFWAILETAIAIIVFWYIALNYQSFFLLYTSLFAAPLLLLRSDESVKQGVEWFERGFWPRKWPDDAVEREAAKTTFVQSCQKIGRLVSISVGTCLLAFAIFTGYIDLNKWPNFILILEYITIIMAMPSFFILIFTFILDGIEPSSEVAIFDIEILVNFFQHLRINHHLFRLIGFFYRCNYLFIAAILIGGAMSSFAIFIRSWATLSNLTAGYIALPTNIRRVILSASPSNAPELVPGLRNSSIFRFSTFVREIKFQSPSSDTQSSSDVIFLLIPVMLLAFFPAFLYRFTLKSTMWFWWILFFIGGAPNTQDGIAALRKDIHEKQLAKLQFGSALLSLSLFTTAHLALPYFANQHSDAPLIPVVAIFHAIDWLALSGFGFLGLISAALTVIVWFWADMIVRDSELPTRTERVHSQMIRLGHVIKWKTGLGALTIALTMLYVALIANATYHWLPVSPWAAEKLHFLYGQYATAVLQ